MAHQNITAEPNDEFDGKEKQLKKRKAKTVQKAPKYCAVIGMFVHAILLRKLMLHF